MAKKIEELSLDSLDRKINTIDTRLKAFAKKLEDLEYCNSHMIMRRYDTTLTELSRKTDMFLDATQGWVNKTIKSMGSILDRINECEVKVGIKEIKEIRNE